MSVRAGAAAAHDGDVETPARRAQSQIPAARSHNASDFVRRSSKPVTCITCPRVMLNARNAQTRGAHPLGQRMHVRGLTDAGASHQRIEIDQHRDGRAARATGGRKRVRHHLHCPTATVSPSLMRASRAMDSALSAVRKRVTSRAAGRCPRSPLPSPPTLSRHRCRPHPRRAEAARSTDTYGSSRAAARACRVQRGATTSSRRSAVTPARRARAPASAPRRSAPEDRVGCSAKSATRWIARPALSVIGRTQDFFAMATTGVECSAP